MNTAPRRIVVDASAWVIAIIDQGTKGDAARTALVGGESWVVPPHTQLEVLRTLVRLVRAGHMTAAQADVFARVVVDADIAVVGPVPWLLEKVWSLREAVSMYDAPYLALALELPARLVTADLRLARGARALGAEVLAVE